MQFETSSNSPIAWTTLWNAIKHYGSLIILVSISTVASAYIALSLTTEQYDISASVLVRLGRENLQPPMTLGNNTGLFTTTGVRTEEINSEIQLLTSRDLIVEAIDRIGIDAFKSELTQPQTPFQRIKYYAKSTIKSIKSEFQKILILLDIKKQLSERDKLIIDIEDRLTVEKQKESDVISLKLRLQNSDLGIRLLNNILSIYLYRHIKLHHETNFREFVEEKADHYKQELTKLDKLKESTRNKWSIVAVAEQKNLLLNRLNVVIAEIENFTTEYQVLTKQMDGKADIIAVDKSAIISEPSALKSVRERIASLKSELVNLLVLFDDHSPIVKDMKERIQNMENILLSSIKVRLSIQKELAKELKLQLIALAVGEVELDLIDREEKIANENYVQYMKRREDARISEELDLRKVSNVAVLSFPTSTLEPVYPKKLLLIGLSIPLGLLIGIVLALLIDYLRNIVRSQADLDDISGLEYLGTFRLTKSSHLD